MKKVVEINKYREEKNKDHGPSWRFGGIKITDAAKAMQRLGEAINKIPMPELDKKVNSRWFKFKCFIKRIR